MIPSSLPFFDTASGVPPDFATRSASALSGSCDAAVKELTAKAEEIAKAGGTPLGVAKDGKLLGVIYLKDIV